MFEEKWHVRVFDNVLEISDPDDRVQWIELGKIGRIVIRTNDSGPIGSDVIWNISDEQSTLGFPMGARGESEVLSNFQQLQGFNNLALIDAMSCVENKIFVIFEKPKA